jgi:hypothetical protein
MRFELTEFNHSKMLIDTDWRSGNNHMILYYVVVGVKCRLGKGVMSDLVLAQHNGQKMNIKPNSKDTIRRCTNRSKAVNQQFVYVMFDKTADVATDCKPE